MKKLILILLVIGASFSAKSQTQDTAFHTMTAVKITPVKMNFFDPVNVDHLAILITNDDLKTSADLIYIFYDSSAIARFQGIYHISGSVYTAWNHTFLQTYTVLGTHLGITYQ